MSKDLATEPGRTRILVTCGAAVVFSTLAVTASLAKDDDDDGSNSGGWTESITNSVKDYMGGATKRLGFGKPPPPPDQDSAHGCPTISILPGTEVQRVMAPGGTGNTSLRYQFSLLSVGRECAAAGNQVTIKVGADGRVLLGPAGQAGRFDVPIRVAVYSEAQQKAVESRLFKVAVSLGGGQASMPFSFVSNGITVAIPQGRSGEYSIKVGIDAGKSAGDPATKTKHARRKSADTQSASQ